MGLGFKKSIKIAPGVRVNLGKKSAGLSFGVKGASYSINSSGRKTTTIGIPGTGLSYSTSSRKKHSTAKSKRNQLECEMAKAEKEKLKQLGEALGIEKMNAEVADLEKQTEAEGFWNDLENSQKVQKRISQLKNKIKAYDR